MRQQSLNRFLVANEVVVDKVEKAAIAEAVQRVKLGQYLLYGLGPRGAPIQLDDVAKLAGKGAAARELHAVIEVLAALEQIIARDRRLGDVDLELLGFEHALQRSRAPSLNKRAAAFVIVRPSNSDGRSRHSCRRTRGQESVLHQSPLFRSHGTHSPEFGTSAMISARKRWRRTAVPMVRRLVWGFSCQAVVSGCADGFLFGAGKAVFRPVACDQVRGARGRGQGTETVAKLGGLPLSDACVSQRLDA